MRAPATGARRSVAALRRVVAAAEEPVLCLLSPSPEPINSIGSHPLFSSHRPPGPAFGRPEDRPRPVPISDMGLACVGVIQLRYLTFSFLYPSFPRKREPRAFSHLLLGPRFRGDDGLSCPQDFLTASKAGTHPSHRHRSEPALGPATGRTRGPA